MSILFSNQWKNSAGKRRAIPQISTKNQSFLRTCQLFKKMGVSNYLFPLCLYDPDLLNVDPHDLDEDTPENEQLRIKVQIEASRNAWYYLRECVRIYEQGGSPIRFRLDRGSAAMAWCFLNGIDYVGMQPRQSGKTVCALALTSWVLYSSGYEYALGLLTKDNKLRVDNVRRVRSFGESLPKWWIVEDKNKDKKNSEELYYDALRTQYVTMVAQTDKRGAEQQGRGASLPMIHIDELEFCSMLDITYPAMMASTVTARANAKKNGKPHSNIITTTAGDPTTKECKAAIEILNGAMPFSEHLYDVANNDKLIELVKTISPKIMILGVFSHLQLGFSNEWLRDVVIRNNMTREQVCRDYLNRRVSIADKPVIAPEVLVLINGSQREHTHIQILSDKFVIYWYVSEERRKSAAFKDRPIVVGCDSSEMIDRDATTLIGVDPQTLETVFSFRCAEGNINRVGVMIAQLMLMLPKMILIPENKSSGTSIIDTVSLILRENNHNPFTRIFNWVVNNRNMDEFAAIDIRNKALLDTSIKRHFGIKTDKNKREELYGSTLMDATKRAATKVHDRVLIEELNALTIRNGRIDHAAGAHDDTVIAWLLAMWFILNAKHLDIYGIKPGTVLSSIDPAAPDQNKLAADHQRMVRDKIDEWETKLKSQRDPKVRRILESDIVVLRKMLGDTALLVPDTADDLNRDPSRFTDRQTAAASHSPVDTDHAVAMMRALFQL